MPARLLTAREIRRLRTHDRAIRLACVLPTTTIVLDRFSARALVLRSTSDTRALCGSHDETGARYALARHDLLSTRVDAGASKMRPFVADGRRARKAGFCDFDYLSLHKLNTATLQCFSGFY